MYKLHIWLWSFVRSFARSLLLSYIVFAFLSAFALLSFLCFGLHLHFSYLDDGGDCKSSVDTSNVPTVTRRFNVVVAVVPPGGVSGPLVWTSLSSFIS